MLFQRGAPALWLLSLSCIVAAPATASEREVGGETAPQEASAERDTKKATDTACTKSAAPDKPPSAGELLRPIATVVICNDVGRRAGGDGAPDEDFGLDALDESDWGPTPGDLRLLSAQPLSNCITVDLQRSEASGHVWSHSELSMFLSQVFSFAAIDFRRYRASATSYAWIQPGDFSSIWLLTETSEALNEIDPLETLDAEIR